MSTSLRFDNFRKSAGNMYLLLGYILRPSSFVGYFDFFGDFLGDINFRVFTGLVAGFSGTIGFFSSTIVKYSVRFPSLCVCSSPFEAKYSHTAYHHKKHHVSYSNHENIRTETV